MVVSTELINFHGHVHSSVHKPFRYVKNRIDVGVDNIGIVPKTFLELKLLADLRTS